MAKAGAELPQSTGLTSVTHARRKLREWRQQETNKWWSNVATERYKTLGIKEYPKKGPDLPRAIAVRLYAAKIGHGNFTSYLQKIGKPTPRDYNCGQKLSPLYFLKCPFVKRK